MTIDQAMEIAVKHHQAGRLMEAETIYRQVLSQRPENPNALYLLGSIAGAAGKLDAAEDLIRRAIAIAPQLAEAHNNLGSILRGLGKSDEAIAAFKRAIEIEPEFAVAYTNLGNTLYLAGRLDDAFAAYERAVAIDPRDAGAHSNLGNALRDKGLPDQAITECRRALELDPNLPVAHTNLANALLDKRLLDDAIVSYRKTVALLPESAESHNNLGAALGARELFDEAIAAYREAIRLKPEYIQAHWNLAILLLALGHFREGWEELEWRSKIPTLDRKLGQPKWDGSEVPGKTILIHAEAGYGDAIQFVRLIPLLRSRVAKFILECQPPLITLFQNFPGVDQIMPRGEALPEFDLQIPLPSLARILNVSLENMPNVVPYLTPPPDRVAFWAARLREYKKRKIGLVWAGSNFSKSAARSRSIEIFRPLAGVEGLQLFSLQKDPAEATKFFEAMRIIDFTSELHDFAQTAALIENLDLIISVDTSVAHLAGALGKPVWVLIPKPTDFRWLMDREDSPWYPTMRLFRQTTPGEWGEVVEKIAGCLEGLGEKSEI
jgi:tetratricopeptide (TPR) repeat protein